MSARHNRMLARRARRALLLLEILESRTLLSSDLRFAVIGDYGSGNQAESDVASLVQSWHPAFVTTVGDNNYPDGDADTIDQNIGQFYHNFLSPYNGTYGSGAAGGQNRFFPSLGDADWGEDDSTPDPDGDAPYINYFNGDLPSGPGGGRYYDVTMGNVELFVLDSNANEPSGTASTSAQADWLQGQMQSSTAQWKIVIDHTPPYSSGVAQNAPTMQWPFQAWGATAVISGQDHDYERLFEGGLPYFVDGEGGGNLAPFPNGFEAGSEAHYDADYGAMLIDASPQAITFEFVSRTGQVIDSSTIPAAGAPAPTTPPAPSGLTATAVSPTQVNLSWTDNATDESGFLVSRSTDDVNFQQIAETASGVTTYQDASASPGVTYYYQVQTVLNTTPVSSSTHTELDSTASTPAETTTLPLPTTTLTYLSSLPIDSSSTSLDLPASYLLQNNTSYFDNPISLKGTVYSEGVGTHANSSLVYDLDGQDSLFLADVGIDDEEAGNPAAVFLQVLGDGKLIYSSGVILTNSATLHIDVNVSGVQQLTLVTDALGGSTDDVAESLVNSDTDHDSVVWAGARVYGATVAPTTTATPTGTAGTSGWYTSAVGVTLAATDPDYPSAVLTTTFSLDNGPAQSYTAGQVIAINGDGTHTLTYQSEDPAGDIEITKTLTIPIDTTPPATAAVLSPPTGPGGLYIAPVTVTLTAKDATSGVAATYYTLDGAAAQTYTGPFVVSSVASHTVTYYSVDKAGNSEAAHSLSFVISPAPVAPTTTATATGTSGTGGWYTSAVGVTLMATDANYPLSALTTTFGLDSGPTQIYTPGQVIAITGNGIHTLTYQSEDPADDIEPLRTLTIPIDTTPPATTAALSPPTGPGGLYIAPVTVTLTATDATSGVAATYYTLDGAAAQTYSGPFVVSAVASHSLTYYSVDKAGNSEAAHSLSFVISPAPVAPATTAAATGTSGTGGWYTSAVSVTLVATDLDYAPSALTTTFSLDNGPTQTYAGQAIAITGDGIHILKYQSENPLGEIETTKTLTVSIDTTPPATAAVLSPPTGPGGLYIAPVTVTLTAKDATSGVAATYYTLDGAAAQTYTGPFVVSSVASHTVTYYSVDKAGNSEAAHSLSFVISPAPVAPTTTATATGTSGTGGWYTSAVGVTLMATDANYPLSALTTTFGLDSGPTQIYTPGQVIAITGNGIHTLTYQSEDPADDIEPLRTLTIPIDTTPPATTAALSPPTGPGGLYIAPVTVTLTATDATSGVAATYYTLDGAAAQTYSGPFVVSAVASHSLTYYSVDKAGNSEAAHSLSFVISPAPVAPATTAAATGTSGTGGWYTSAVSVTLVATDLDYAPSALTTTFSLDNGPTQTYAGQAIAITGDGIHILKYQSENPLGEIETTKTLTVSIDTTPPATAAVLSPPTGPGGLYIAPVTVTLTAKDATSGVAATYYTLDGAAAQTYTGPFVVSAVASHSLTYYSVDKAGNSEAAHSLSFKISPAPVPPTTVAAATGTSGTGGWYTSAVHVTLMATDANYPLSALTTTFSLDSGPTQIYTPGQSIAITANGIHTLTYQSEDPVGDTEALKTLTVSIDTTPPATTAALSPATGPGGLYVAPVTVTLTAKDATSGVAATYYTLDGAAPQTYSGPFVVSAVGSHTLTYYSVDKAGNREAANSLSFLISSTIPFNNSIGVLVLDPTGKGALNVSTSGTIVDNGGIIAVNSSNASGVIVSGSSSVSATQIDATGGITTSGKGSVTGKVVNQLPTADPLAGLAAPAVPSKAFAAVNYTGRSNLTLSPGTYVGGIALNGSGTVVLNPGIYYMQGGGFTVGGTGYVVGLGVLIYNAPGNTGGAINLSGQGTVVLTPQTSGAYAGITLFQARTSNLAVQIGGQETLAMTGALYAPSASLNISSQGRLFAQDDPFDSIKARIITADLNVSGTGVLSINPFGSNPVSLSVVADTYAVMVPDPTNNS